MLNKALFYEYFWSMWLPHLNVVHVGLYDIEPVLIDQLLYQSNALQADLSVKPTDIEFPIIFKHFNMNFKMICLFDALIFPLLELIIVKRRNLKPFLTLQEYNCIKQCM